MNNSEEYQEPQNLFGTLGSEEDIYGYNPLFYNEEGQERTFSRVSEPVYYYHEE